MKLLRSRGAGALTATFAPHGPLPYAATARAAGQELSSKVRCCQPSGPAWLAFQDASVTAVGPPGTVSLAIVPAGLCVVFSLRTAMVFAPAVSRFPTSRTAAVFHESATRGESLTCVPLTHTVALSSPVTTSVAFDGAAARVSDLRKNRVDGGTPPAGSPSGYQIQLAPARSGPAAARPRNAPVHSVAGARNAVSKRCTGLQPLIRPWPSQTRTRQVYAVSEASAGPP